MKDIAAKLKRSVEFEEHAERIDALLDSLMRPTPAVLQMQAIHAQLKAAGAFDPEPPLLIGDE